MVKCENFNSNKMKSKPGYKCKSNSGNRSVEVYDYKKCGTKHKQRNSSAYGKECRSCKKLNHFEIGCKNKSKSKRVYETSVVTGRKNCDEDSDDEFKVNEIKSVVERGIRQNVLRQLKW